MSVRERFATTEPIKPILTFLRTFEKTDTPIQSIAIPDIIKKPIQNLTTSLSMPQNIAGIGIGGLIIVGIILFFVFGKGK